jgi:hypothetical protein
MKRQMIWLLMLAGGCARYTQGELDLVTEARKGVKLVADAQTIVNAQNEATATERRARIDEAFDTDIRERKSLDAEWVIIERKAYAAALGALANQQAKDAQLAETTQNNLRETDTVLERLAWMLKIQGNLFDMKEAK